MRKQKNVPRSLVRAAAAIFAVVLAVRLGIGLGGLASHARRGFDMSYVDMGEGLLHASHPSNVLVSDRMPIGTLLEARLLIHAGASGMKAGVAGFAAAAWIMMAALAGLLGPPVLALGALGLGTLTDPLGPLGSFKMFFFSPFILLVACLLAWRARAPAPFKTVLLGCAVGASLLYRGTLILFPFVLALYEWRFVHRSSLRRAWKDILLLCGIPMIFLLPWIAMNHSLGYGFVPLERSSASNIIVPAAMGLPALDGDISALMGDAGQDKDTMTALGWAVGEVLAHPWRYMKGVAVRIFRIVAVYPGLFLLAGAGLWLNREREEMRALGLLLLYFCGIHSLMSFLPYYIHPVRPLLCVLGATALLWPFTGRRPEKRSLGYRASAVVMALGTAAALLVSLDAAWIASSYARRTAAAAPDSEEALATALAVYPDDAWLLVERGRRHVGRGDHRSAAADFARAVEQPSRLPRAVLEDSWASGERRGNGGDSSGSEELNDPVVIRRSVYEALEHIGARRHAQARAALSSAADRWALRQKVHDYAPGKHARRIEERLRRGSDLSFLHEVENIMKGRPARDILSLADEFIGARPEALSLRMLHARLAIDAGRTLTAAASLAKAEDLSPGTDARREIAQHYSRAGLASDALRLLKRLAAEGPPDAALLTDKAVAEFMQGRPDAAEKDLRQAIALDPAFLPASLTLGALLTKNGRPDDAAAVYDEALARPAAADQRGVRQLMEESRAELRKREQRH